MSVPTELYYSVIIAYVRLQPCHVAEAVKPFVPRILTQWPAAAGVTQRGS